MYSSDPKAAPPLWLWIILALVIVLMVPVVSALNVFITGKEFEKKTSYVQQRIQSAGTRPVIVLLGTSLTGYGIELSGNIEKSIEQTTHIKPVLVKIWR